MASYKLEDKLNTFIHIDTSSEKNVTSCGKAFLRGMNADNLLSKNATACFNDVTTFYYHELPTIEIKNYYGSF
jgi:hypothetical protein